MNYLSDLLEILSAEKRLRRDLELVQALNLPDWCIAAGYVRNLVWDRLHGFAGRTPLEDVDVLIYDRSDVTEDAEKKLEERLRRISPQDKWSVKNQARMHIRNNESEYVSIEDAMKRWPETATAVGVRLDPEGGLRIIAPHGLEDLFELKLRPSSFCPDKEMFLGRVRNKRWLTTWPRLTLVDS
ncbi:nucleotidyltransferase family protein [Cohnella sp. AR92]|uniref:nucleotidyltransferase family protein n=1 Tax=Cohnella sp. AR92 TaxID=648716 RepID=UPI000F8D9B78|nr:nucleotidyltransferase family protein [Cohnella sp. AR92]RUS49107.1 nucleotidyltransferase family protein [Cohnella sp. AR92]